MANSANLTAGVTPAVRLLDILWHEPSDAQGILAAWCDEDEPTKASIRSAIDAAERLIAAGFVDVRRGFYCLTVEGRRKAVSLLGYAN